MSISSTVRRNAQTLKCYILAKLFPEKYIVYRASLRIKKGEPVHNNWGDDINPVIIELLSGKKALFLPNSILSRNFPIKNYLVVGSLLTFYPLDKTHVWGAGIINENKIENITTKPFRVSAVRGPLTRNALIEKDIECPLVYGDPALLLPLLYYPCVHRENKIGIIPHFIDVHEKSVEKLLTYKHTKLINVRGYKEWKEFIDEICSCNFIVLASGRKGHSQAG